MVLTFLTALCLASEAPLAIPAAGGIPTAEPLSEIDHAVRVAYQEGRLEVRNVQDYFGSYRTDWYGGYWWGTSYRRSLILEDSFAVYEGEQRLSPLSYYERVDPTVHRTLKRQITGNTAASVTLQTLTIAGGIAALLGVAGMEAAANANQLQNSAIVATTGSLFFLSGTLVAPIPMQRARRLRTDLAAFVDHDTVVNEVGTYNQALRTRLAQESSTTSDP